VEASSVPSSFLLLFGWHWVNVIRKKSFNMKKKSTSILKLTRLSGKEKAKNPVGYPLYPESQDVYSQFKREAIANNEPQEPLNDNNQEEIQGDYDENLPNYDLDIPGSELDNAQERIGSEDEENNYYSIGGDNHDDLEEDRG
jgi:hypothetical protein